MILGNIKMYSGKTEMSLYVLLLSSRFSSWNSAMQAILPSLFLMVES